MSNFLKKYSHLKLYELIEICESDTDSYTKKAKEAAQTIIELMDPEITELKAAAIKYWDNKINSNIKTLIMKGEIPKSSYLNTDEITELMKSAFIKWRSKQELMGIDTTKYWAFPF